MSATVLEVDNLSRAFGGVQAVDGVSFALRAGEIVGLIGPNGAGKTTLVNLITGVVTPGSGRIQFEGRDVTLVPFSGKREVYGFRQKVMGAL